MAQHDYSIANQGFPATRADINNVLSAIATNNSGTSAPASQFAGQFWIDTTSSTWTMYIHDGTDDIQFATIDTSANTVNFIDSALASDVVINTSGDITTTGAFTSVGIDDNAISTALTINGANNATFSGIVTADEFNFSTSGDLHAGSTASSITIAGGTNSNVGSNVSFHGSTHASLANVVRFRAGSSETMRINSSGSVTKPNQPAFLANRTTGSQSNIAPNDTIIFPNERYDQQSNFASDTFTAPVTGKYHFSFVVSVNQLDYDATFNRIILNTSNKGYNFSITSSQQFNGADPTYYAFQGSLTVDMDSGDTAFLKFSQSGGASTADVFDSTYFSGYLVC